MRTANLIGTTCGRWEVLSFADPRDTHLMLWCRCECGTEQRVQPANLKNGRSTQCKHCSLTALRNGHAAQSVVLATYRCNAKRRDREWSLTDAQFLSLCLSDCHYCGREPYTTHSCKYDSFIYNGIDRKDNAVGYTAENSLPCCKECNLRKGTMGYEEFTAWIHIISNSTPEYGLSGC
jgi:hypothetical protein